MSTNLKFKKSGIISMKFNTLLLILLSFFYLQDYSTFSQIIITIPLAVEMVVLIKGFHSFALKRSIIFGIIIIAYTVFTQLLIMRNFECLSFLFSISYFVFAHNCIKYLSKKDIIKYSKLLLIFGIIILILDTIWRFTHPVYADFYSGIYSFYKYKSKGILFVDTNNTGMLCLAILSFILYLDNILGIKYKKMDLIYVVLLILTFSRAAILAYILMIIFLNKRFPKNLKKLAIIGFLLMGIGLIPKVLGDVSTISKFDMFAKVISYWKEASFFELVFGVGFTNSIEKIGMFTHSWPLTFSFEFGIVGIVLMLLFWYFMYKESNKKATYILIPCLFAGISYLPLLIPYIYTFVVIIIMLEKKKEEAIHVN